MNNSLENLHILSFSKVYISLSKYYGDSSDPRRLIKNPKTKLYLMHKQRIVWKSIKSFVMNKTLMWIKIVKIKDYLRQTMVLSTKDSLLYLINQFILFEQNVVFDSWGIYTFRFLILQLQLRNLYPQWLLT